MKKVLLALSSLLLLTLSMSSIAQTNVAVFNLREVLKNDAQVQAEQEKMRNQFLSDGQKIVAEKKALQSDIKTLSAMKDKNTVGAKQLIGKINQARKDLFDHQSAFQRKLAQVQQDTSKKILERVKSAVAQVAKAKQFDLVLTERDVAYNQISIDITREVIEAMKKTK